MKGNLGFVFFWEWLKIILKFLRKIKVFFFLIYSIINVMYSLRVMKWWNKVGSYGIKSNFKVEVLIFGLDFKERKVIDII